MKFQRVTLGQTTPFSFEPGAFFAGRYEILERIGPGTFAWTLKARDTALDGEIVCLKILFPQFSADESVTDRLSREVLLVRQLAHPTIVRVFDLDQDETHGHFISMEYIEGWSLDRVLKNAYRELKPEYKVKILFEIAKALEFAHKRGVIHRDLRPGNVLLSKNGEVKLSDFSIARSLEDESGLTRTGEIIGSPSYMAPEQFLGEEIDCQADIYAFGLLAIEVLSGQAECTETDYLKIASRRLEGSEPAPTRNLNNVSPWLQKLICECCKTNKSERIPSGSQLVDLFQENVGKLESRVIQLRLPSLQKGRRKNLLLGLGYLFLSCFVLLTFTYVMAQQRSARIFIGANLLRFEALSGYEPILLKRLVNVHTSLSDPDPIGVALGRRDINELRLLMAAGAASLPITEASDDLLHHLYSTADIDFPEVFRIPAFLNGRNAMGDTPVISAIKSRKIDEVELLLKYPVDLSLNNDIGLAAIHVSALTGQEQMIQLLKAHANLDQLDANGNTAMHLAVLGKNPGVLKALLNAGANIETRDAIGRTPLMVALQNHNNSEQAQKLYTELMRGKPQLDARDTRGNTALHYAVKWADFATIELLVESGASLSTRNGKGLSAIQLAAEMGRKDVVESLEKHLAEEAAGG